MPTPEAARWRDTLARLTPYPVGPTGYLIGRGQPLDQSHRHFSHLLMVYPLRLVTGERPGERALIEKSLAHWIGFEGALQGYSFVGRLGHLVDAGQGGGRRAPPGRPDPAVREAEHHVPGGRAGDRDAAGGGPGRARDAAAELGRADPGVPRRARPAGRTPASTTCGPRGRSWSAPSAAGGATSGCGCTAWRASRCGCGWTCPTPEVSAPAGHRREAAGRQLEADPGPRPDAGAARARRQPPSRIWQVAPVPRPGPAVPFGLP